MNKPRTEELRLVSNLLVQQLLTLKVLLEKIDNGFRWIASELPQRILSKAQKRYCNSKLFNRLPIVSIQPSQKSSNYTIAF
jgi:hypothetical protein